MRQEWSDEDLVQQLHERDPEALETLISRYSREVFYFIRLVLDGVGVAQDAISQQPATAQQTPDAQQQEEKAKLERKATALLEQVIGEAQSLKLPENRIRIQIAAGDMLCIYDSGFTRLEFPACAIAVSKASADAVCAVWDAKAQRFCDAQRPPSNTGQPTDQ